MNTRTNLIIFAGLLVLVSACGRKSFKETETDKLQGTWASACVNNGDNKTSSQDTVKISGNTYVTESLQFSKIDCQEKASTVRRSGKFSLATTQKAAVLDTMVVDFNKENEVVMHQDSLVTAQNNALSTLRVVRRTPLTPEESRKLAALNALGVWKKDEAKKITVANYVAGSLQSGITLDFNYRQAARYTVDEDSLYISGIPQLKKQ